MAEKTEEKTWSDVAVAAAEESPQAAGLIAAIMEQNARDAVHYLPTWEQVDKARQEGYERGFYDGQEAKEADLMNRLFGYHEPPRGLD